MRRSLPVAVFALFLLVATACGGVENEPNLAEAVKRTEATGSARFEFKVSGTQAGVAEAKCEGAADYDGERFRISCHDEQNGTWEMLELGTVAYIRSSDPMDPSTTQWTRLPAADDSFLRLFSPVKLLAMLRRASRTSERIGAEEVRGEPTVRYRLTVDCQAEEISCAGETGSAEVWIDRDGLVRRIVADDGSALTTIEFFVFGIEVQIEAPPPDAVEELGGGVGTGSGRPQAPSSGPCSERRATPIGESEAFNALRRHGFSVRRAGDICDIGVEAVITNAPQRDAGDVLEREGIIHCFLHERPEKGAPKTVGRRGVDGGDAELRLANLTCMILADSPNAEEKIRPLEQTFEELERAIRP